MCKIFLELFDLMWLHTQPLMEVKKWDLHDVCVSFINRYGNYLKLLKDDALHDLTLLMKHVKILLTTQRIKSSSQLGILFKNLLCISVQ